MKPFVSLFIFENIDIVPTIGFQCEQFIYHGVRFDVFDMSGQGNYRNMWEYYYTDVMGIVFVIDSADKLRLCVAKNELDTLLTFEKKGFDMGSLPILFFANKMDLSDALTAAEIGKTFELHDLKNPHQIVYQPYFFLNCITCSMSS